jgi:hypothetical protein
MSKKKIMRVAYPREADYEEGVMRIQGGAPIILERIRAVAKKRPDLESVARAVSNNIVRSMSGGERDEDGRFVSKMEEMPRAPPRIRVPMKMRKSDAERFLEANDPREMLSRSRWEPSGGEDQMHMGEWRHHYLDYSLIRGR